MKISLPTRLLRRAEAIEAAVKARDMAEQATTRKAANSDDAMRAGTYSLLGTLLARPPGPEVVELLKSIELPAGDGKSAMGGAWEALSMAGERTTVEALDDEYHDLFIGIGRGELVPYGSWYMVGFMMDRPLAVLRRELAAFGFERQVGVCEPEDHAGALCETMSLIIASGDEIPFDTQRQFFSDHVGPWMGRFFQDLQKAKAARFYRAVGRLGEQFLEVEKQYLAMPN